MNKNEFIEKFIRKFCKDCKSPCDKGIIERENFIRCVDKDIFIKKDTQK